MESKTAIVKGISGTVLVLALIAAMILGWIYLRWDLRTSDFQIADSMRTTLSFRLLEWLRNRLPAAGSLTPFELSLLAVLLAVHLLQLPLLIKFRAATTAPQKSVLIWLGLAWAFTEFVPIGWAMANGRAWIVLFNVSNEALSNTQTRLFVAQMIVCAIVVAIFLASIGAGGGGDGGCLLIIAFCGAVAWTATYGLTVPFRLLCWMGLVSAAGARIGALLFSAGTIPLALFLAARPKISA